MIMAMTAPQIRPHTPNFTFPAVAGVIDHTSLILQFFYGWVCGTHGATTKHAVSLHVYGAFSGQDRPIDDANAYLAARSGARSAAERQS
jgi:hypothetical protein